ncbi:DUF2125 domain-containing protein [Halodurantibacterium flavum]|uniref:DUF2125 domain-containing protein n=1 Tax=Halodurantibacterium flavum TaxID=1382802 RepID=A0ABW4S427_9RHOB
MRILPAILVMLALLWGGYWFFGASRAERLAEDWFATAPARGLDAQNGGIAVQGFPNRFDLTIDTPDIMDRATGIGWRAPFLQVFALSYRPHHVIVTWPDRQDLTLGAETYAITSDRMQASAVFEPLNQRLNRATWVAEGLRAESDMRLIEVGSAQLSTRIMAAEANTHEVSLQARGLRLAPLPPALSGDEGTLVFDGLVQMAGPRPGEISVRNLSLRWGEVEVRGQGAITVGQTGLLSGRLELRTDNWREMLALAVEAGLIDPEVAPTWENAMGMLARMSGEPQTLQAPLSFNNGMMSLGPLPLGPAPRF